MMNIRMIMAIFASVGLWGCGAAQVQPNAVYAEAPTLESRKFCPGDGACFGLREWLPEGDPSHVVIALHGFNDYSHAFQGFGEFFAAHGMAVVAPDQRGFGHSAQRGIWAGEANLRHDFRQLVHAVHARFPKIPVVVLGESMGGAVILSALANGDIAPTDVERVVLVAPAIWGGKTMSELYRAPLWLLANLTPDAVLSGKGLRILPSDNLPMLMALAKDSGMVHSSRADAVLGLVHLMDGGYEAGMRYVAKVPTLLLYGAHDMVVPKPPVAEVAAACTTSAIGICRAAWYPDGYHMLLRDLGRQAVIEDIAAWVVTPTAALPSGHEWNDIAASTKD